MQSPIYEPFANHATPNDNHNHTDDTNSTLDFMEISNEVDSEQGNGADEESTSQVEMSTQGDEVNPATTDQTARSETFTESPAVTEGRTAFINGDYTQCISIFTRLIRRMNRRILRNVYNDIVFNWATVKQRDKQRAFYYQFRAIGYLFRSREASNISETLQYLNLALRDATRASSLNDEDPRSWWIRAVCRWSLTQNEVNETRRDQMLTIAIEHAEKARSLLSSNPGPIAEDINAFIREMGTKLLHDFDDHERSESINGISRKRRRSENGNAWNIAGATYDTEQTQDNDTTGQSHQPRDWIDAISTLVQMSESTQLGEPPHHADNLIDYHSDEESSGLDLSSNEMSINGDDEDEGLMWTGHLPLLHSMDSDSNRSSNDSDMGGIVERSSSSEEESTGIRSATDSDEESDSFDDHILRRFRYRPERYATCVQCYNEISSFKGHCNVAVSVVQ
jgi:hypothetical protein